MNPGDLQSWLSAPWRLVRWFLLTRPIRFTRFGWWYIGFALAVGSAAINTGNNLLYLVLGIMLGSIVVSGILSDSSLWQIRVRWLTERTLYAERPALFHGELEKGRFPGLGVTLTTRWSNTHEREISRLFYWLPPNATQPFQLELHPRRRGWLALEEMRYATRFPFGLFEKFHFDTTAQRWLVYPAVRRLPLSLLIGNGAGFNQQAARRAGAGSVPFDLRHFRTGDSARRIHWRSSAKRQQLLVHELEEEAGGASWLVVDSWPTHLSEERMESFISFLASAAVSLGESGRPVGLVTPDMRISPDASKMQRQRMLRYLALVAPADGTPRKLAAPPGDDCIDALAAWQQESR